MLGVVAGQRRRTVIGPRRLRPTVRRKYSWPLPALILLNVTVTATTSSQEVGALACPAEGRQTSIARGVNGMKKRKKRKRRGGVGKEEGGDG
jgi:hypothetical protein